MSKKKISLNFIDLFSGAGGLSCGMEMAGHRCVLGVDHNEYAIKTFDRNHKHAKSFCGDIKKLSTEKIRTLIKKTKIDAIVGGPPCQGFSTVGTGNPNDKRNVLFLEFVRIVKELSPTFVVIENVTGLVAKKNEKTLKAIFELFQKMGYQLAVQVLSAENYGVPERRRRTIIIGTKLKLIPQFPIQTHNYTNKSGKLIPPALVKDVLNSLKTKKGLIYNHDIEKAQLKNEVDAKRLRHIPEGKSIRYEEDEQKYLPPSLHFGVNWKELPEERFRQAKFLRLDGNRPSPTIMTHRQSYFHPTEHRYLTQREGAKLQSFPNDFEFIGPLSEQWRQIGNAVPPLLGRAIGLALTSMVENRKKLQQIKRRGPLKETIKEVQKRAFTYK